MKREDINKYHRASIVEIDQAIVTLEKELVDATMQLKLGQLKNLHQPKTLRQDIAILKTIKREKQLYSSESQSSQTQEKTPKTPKKATPDKKKVVKTAKPKITPKVAKSKNKKKG